MRMVDVVIVPIRWYRLYLSPLKGPTCRFAPTCSEYAILALEKYGVIRGLWKAAGRLLRCHPFHPGGYDPP
ncbi:membrane protein insertion efficiency factor YidD [Heliomicrobium gestii]|nr:putative membrane protein insertion efficiency factor [Heliomicrobium gestii]